MANRYPYISSSGPLTQAVTQLRKSFPSVVDSDLLKKLGLAPNNESYLIRIIRFLGLIENDGKKITDTAKAFVLHDDAQFQAALAEIVHNAYSELFEIRGEDAWSADRASLITFFRQSDESTELVGQRQANTFSTLATLAGKREPISQSRPEGGPKGSVRRAEKKKTPKASVKSIEPEGPNLPPSNPQVKAPNGGMALTVRVEINLPAQADQETYDRIFRSLRTNLIDVK